MPKSSPKLTAHSVGDELLRALAISSVVLIHFMSALHPSPYWNSSPWQALAVYVDQFTRLCVPVFVVLSGYGLSQKYRQQTFAWGSFLQRRVFKLLPWYITWSIIFNVVFWLIPAWQYGPHYSFLHQLIWGKADYQLYFVPMIFQLYILFPAIWWIYRRSPLMVLGLVGVFQVGWYLFLGYHQTHWLDWKFFQTDQQQYFWSISWLWYFVLGLHLTELHAFLRKHALWVWLGIGLTVATLGWAGFDALTAIRNGHDPLLAMRFTRLPILAYASIFSVMATWLVQQVKTAPRAILAIGRYSYGIYLSHTLWLRVLFWLWYR